MALTPEQKRNVARDQGLFNVDAIWAESAVEGLPFYIACALMEKESHGRNVYGNDPGGALAGFPGAVNRSNFAVFRWLVFHEGFRSNGVGPSQITYKGYFLEMEERGLRPWNPSDNMQFGFEKFNDALRAAGGDIAEAGAHYNGGSSPNVDAVRYGERLAVLAAEWKIRIQR